MKYLLDDLIDCVKEHGILKGIYYSDIFDHIYNLPKRIYKYIDKFIYYGKAGTKTYDFDANSLDILIYAHIKRVRKFMDSDNTHLVWNSERKRGLIRKLYELEELCKRKIEYSDLNEHYYLKKEIDKYGVGISKKVLINGKTFYTFEKTEEEKKDKSIAIKKDLKIAKSRKKRYDKLMSEYLDKFWD